EDRARKEDALEILVGETLDDLAAFASDAPIAVAVELAELLPSPVARIPEEDPALRGRVELAAERAERQPIDGAIEIETIRDERGHLAFMQSAKLVHEVVERDDVAGFAKELAIRLPPALPAIGPRQADERPVSIEARPTPKGRIEMLDVLAKAEEGIAEGDEHRLDARSRKAQALIGERGERLANPSGIARLALEEKKPPSLKDAVRVGAHVDAKIDADVDASRPEAELRNVLLAEKTDPARHPRPLEVGERVTEDRRVERRVDGKTVVPVRQRILAERRRAHRVGERGLGPVDADRLGPVPVGRPRLRRPIAIERRAKRERAQALEGAIGRGAPKEAKAIDPHVFRTARGARPERWSDRD